MTEDLNAALLANDANQKDIDEEDAETRKAEALFQFPKDGSRPTRCKYTGNGRLGILRSFPHGERNLFSLVKFDDIEKPKLVKTKYLVPAEDPIPDLIVPVTALEALEASLPPVELVGPQHLPILARAIAVAIIELVKATQERRSQIDSEFFQAIEQMKSLLYPPQD